MPFNLSDILGFSSNGLKRNALYAAATSFAGKANATHQKLLRAERAAQRSPNAAAAAAELSTAFQMVATDFWSVIATATTAGFDLDADSLLDFVSNGSSKPRSDAVIMEFARLTKQSVETIIKREDERRLKLMEQAKSTQAGFIAAMHDSEWNGKTSDPVIEASRLNAALVKTQAFVMGWSDINKATAELILLSKDQELIEAELDREAVREESQPSAAVIALDERLANGADLQAAQQSGK